MKLSNLLEGLPDIEVSDICLDSRKAAPGALFFAVTGAVRKGSEFIPDAVKNGAVVVIGDEDLHDVGVPYFKVNDIRKTISQAAGRFFHNKPKYIVAVTGTNGKTSIASFCAQMFKKLGLKSATIGTLGVVSDDYSFDFGVTTPDAIEFHKTLQKLAENGVEAVAYEASSHGLDQHRAEDVDLKAAGFTNLTQDHLDYHKNMEDYLLAKKKLFTEVLPQNGIAIINADSDAYEKFADSGRKTWSYGKNGKELKLISAEGRNIAIEVFGKPFKYETMLVGDFQIMNSLCAMGMIIACGFDKEKVTEIMPSLTPPPGRLDFAGKMSNGAEIYVDYAHTPDALEKAIKALRPYAKNNLAVLFGCGGDRDKTKRPKMGKAAEDFADIVYVTDDNPRTEDAQTIRREVLAGCPNKGIDAGDRKTAVKTAMSKLKSGDILLLAGKGHEDYQIIGTTKYHLDDKEEVRKNLR
ncbi:MAG: UDP-N-acetylmuramoyl-L-alanyl-D-glutamate--2,6-diaminopimelate ligase [Lactobacillaceae bacterium]|jgi:UDP-N-acetylmuramoyl-L-alanyl-D-glutamate--2,6-diaminopimelate ligase|nr:UDP-N-acetylmuramoyl-L-alanyl-D-glutamate--2,6-diaminopimelate ligase [Lactobacillaceae bacterium]